MLDKEEIKNTVMPILLVDDEPKNLFAYEVLLDDYKTFKTIRANSGSEAIEQLRIHNDVGLILMDIRMPKMNGIETAKMIKSNTTTQHIPIIFITALSEGGSWMNKSYGTGALDFLTKPINDVLLVHKARSYSEAYKDRLRLSALRDEYYEQGLELKREQEALDKFVYIVSHDLKSPVKNLQTLVTLLAADLDKNNTEGVKAVLKMISNSALTMDRLVSDVFDYCKSVKRTLEKEDINFSLLLADVLEKISNPAKIRIKSNFKNLNNAWLSIIAIKQILTNLISNAIKYGNKEDLKIEISGVYDKHKNEIKFFVRDNGVGIDKKHHSSLFEIMNTAGEKGDKSTGIGLCIVKTMVERLNGKVWLESEIGNGSTFYFTCKPLIQEEMQEIS